MANPTRDRVPIEPQSVDAPLSSAAIFLVMTIAPGDEALARARSVISDIGALVRAVGIRDLNGHLSCNVGIGSDAWDRLGMETQPAQLHPFSEVRGPTHTAVSTPGDLLFHIRAERSDLCFELERLILNALGDSGVVVDEVQGFRYFDARDLLGFVDGTENPTGNTLYEATLIGEEDAEFAGGAYVVVQKYLHNLTTWGELSTEEQESPTCPAQRSATAA
jgi:putative iron-dependent peroxidase